MDPDNNNNQSYYEPTYPEMIIEAIAKSKERKGTNRMTISKYMKKVYKGNLPANHDRLLTFHLKKMVAAKSLESIPIPQDPQPRVRLRRSPKPITPNGPSHAQPNTENMLVPVGPMDDSPNPKRVRRNLPRTVGKSTKKNEAPGRVTKESGKLDVCEGCNTSSLENGRGHSEKGALSTSGTRVETLVEGSKDGAAAKDEFRDGIEGYKSPPPTPPGCGWIYE